MIKVNQQAQPKRISHPPHMPRYRMMQRNRVTKLLNFIRHTLGTSVCRGSDLHSTKKPGWFQQRRNVKKAINRVSGNRLVLIDNGFRGKNKRHWFYHRNCGNNLFISPHTIIQDHEHVCVYCQGASDMKACGTSSLMQKFVYQHSEQKVMTPQRQFLKSTSDEYAFFCLIHRDSYFTSFKHFLDTAGITNGCPQCAGEASSWAGSSTK